MSCPSWQDDHISGVDINFLATTGVIRAAPYQDGRFALENA
jgi:hypothetical protein